MKYASLIAAVASLLIISPADAASEDFFDNLVGNWTGSGKAYVKKYGEISARCRVSIKGTEVVIIMSGSCGMLVFQQPLGLSLQRAGKNRYVGTYTGSRTGPAKLEGTLRGNRLVMAIRWGGLVNGDRTAHMVLERTGPNSFAQTVIDSVAGRTRNTAKFAFIRE